MLLLRSPPLRDVAGWSMRGHVVSLPLDIVSLCLFLNQWVLTPDHVRIAPMMDDRLVARLSEFQFLRLRHSAWACIRFMPMPIALSVIVPSSLLSAEGLWIIVAEPCHGLIS